MKTEAELLESTGNVWRVLCFRDGNRRSRPVEYFVRADTRTKAENRARELSGYKNASATAWDPSRDVGRYIQPVTPEATA